MNIYQKGFANIIIVIALVAIVAVGFVYVGITKKSSNLDLASPNSAQKAETPQGWMSYENKEIGIAFQHPSSWGTLEVHEDTWCATDVNYYDKNTLAQIKADRVKSPEDKCNQVTIGPASSRYSEGVAPFLSTMSPLFIKYPVPRGGGWSDMAQFAADDSYVKNLCLNNGGTECSTFTNQHGVFVAKSKQLSVREGESDEIYFYYIHSPNPLYPGVVMTSSFLVFNDFLDTEQDFEKVVDTLRFLPQ